MLLAVPIYADSDEPPKEFRLFRFGKNKTTKGTFLFDEKSAKLVMAEHAAHGIELMVDYAHASLAGGDARDPAKAGKAAGWFALEVRADGLWAVNVRWTASASAALVAKEWRYMSPAFDLDSDGRVVELINVALTNLPATDNLKPLMAASRMETDMLSPEMTKKALDVIAAGDEAAALQMVSDILAAAAGGEEDPAPEPADGELPPLPMADDDEDPAKLAEDEDEDPTELAAAVARLAHITGKPNVGEAVREAQIWRRSHMKLTEGLKKLARDQRALEAGERMRHARTLVNGGFAPAMAYEDTTVEADKLKLSAMLLAMPMKTLRVEAAKASAVILAKGGSVERDDAPIAPKSGSSEGVAQTVMVRNKAVQLSALEVKQIAQTAKAKGVDLAEMTDNYAEIKLRQGRTAPMTPSN